MSARIVVRRSRGSDAPVVHRIRSLPETRRYQPIVPDTVGQLELILAERGALPLTPDQAGKVQWIVEVDGEVTGWVSVEVTSRSHHIATIGYSLDPRFHGRGVVTAAVGQVLPIVFDPAQLHIERLEAVAAVGNVASRKVLEKCGFTFEGIARGYLIISGERVDHTRYARLHTDP